MNKGKIEALKAHRARFIATAAQFNKQELEFGTFMIASTKGATKGTLSAAAAYVFGGREVLVGLKAQRLALDAMIEVWEQIAVDAEHVEGTNGN